MKPALFFLILALLFSSQTNADGFDLLLPKHPRERPRPTATRIVGVSAVCIGAAGTLLGFLVYAETNGQDYPGLFTGIGGIVLVAIGTGLIIGDTRRQRNRKVSIVTQKRNQIGLAYNF